MKTIISKVFATASVAMLFTSCKPELNVPAASKGSLDVTNYVAIGNSITAGYSDNALYRDAQLVSYPNLIAQQFKLIGGNSFNQPLVASGSVGVGSGMNAKLLLGPGTDCMGNTSLVPMNVAPSGDMSIFAVSVAAEGPFNNMSVPGLKAITAVYPGYGDYNQGPGNFNPYFTRMTTNPQSASILSEAAAQNPTFFSLFLGSDDALSYAISGGTADAITPPVGPPGFGFNESIDLIINTLTAGGAKGVVANIPEINTLPYFTTIPYNGLMLDEANAQALSAAYAPLGISFQAGSNGFIIEDASAPGGMRQIVQGEMVLLTVPQDSLKCGGWGSMKPIPNQFVLTADEITQINESVSDYNTKLQAAASDKGLAFVDVNAFMSMAKTGIMYNGIGMNAQFVTGGIFSLDGINLTPIGNAMLANEFIKAINAKYGSSIPRIDATKYKGIIFP